MSNAALAGRPALFLLLSFPLVLMAYRGLPVGLGPLSGMLVPLTSVLSATILFFGTRYLLRTEGSSLGEFGFTPAPRAFLRLAAGFVGGMLLVGVIALSILGLLPMHWTFNGALSAGSVLMALFHHLITNTCEELAFRGYGFARLRGLIGMWPAQAIVAGISAVFHVVCGWSWQVALVHTTAGSLLFALVFLRWRSIPAAIGVHAAWNWTRDLILSMPPGPSSLLVPVQDRPWTGTEWLLVQGLLVGGTLLACLGILVSMPKAERS